MKLIKIHDNAVMMFDNYPDIISKIKSYIDKSSVPVYIDELYTLVEDKLINGFRFSETHNHMTLPNMLKYVFSKSYGYSKVGGDTVICKYVKHIEGHDDYVYYSLQKAIMRTDLLETFNLEKWKQTAALNVDSPMYITHHDDDNREFVRATAEEAKMVRDKDAQEHAERMREIWRKKGIII